MFLTKRWITYIHQEHYLMIVVCPDNRVQWFVGVIQKETPICCIDAKVIGTKWEKTCNVIICIVNSYRFLQYGKGYLNWKPSGNFWGLKLFQYPAFVPCFCFVYVCILHVFLCWMENNNNILQQFALQQQPKFILLARTRLPAKVTHQINSLWLVSLLIHTKQKLTKQ